MLVNLITPTYNTAENTLFFLTTEFSQGHDLEKSELHLPRVEFVFNFHSYLLPPKMHFSMAIWA